MGFNKKIILYKKINPKNEIGMIKAGFFLFVAENLCHIIYATKFMPQNLCHKKYKIRPNIC